jgi:hypothetical protein
MFTVTRNPVSDTHTSVEATCENGVPHDATVGDLIAELVKFPHDAAISLDGYQEYDCTYGQISISWKETPTDYDRKRLAENRKIQAAAKNERLTAIARGLSDQDREKLQRILREI